MYAILFIATMLGMGLVVRIKNDILRAAIGIPMLVAMFCLSMLTFASAISAQWKPDRPDYVKQSNGNFSLVTDNLVDAIDICVETLKTNGVVVKPTHVDKRDNITPIFIRTKDKGDNNLLFAYVTKKELGHYVVCFRYVPNEDGEFIEDFVILRYEGLD
jgi:hypothetical protein